jgi:hypothetical protein
LRQIGHQRTWGFISKWGSFQNGEYLKFIIILKPDNKSYILGFDSKISNKTQNFGIQILEHTEPDWISWIMDDHGMPGHGLQQATNVGMVHGQLMLDLRLDMFFFRFVQWQSLNCHLYLAASKSMGRMMINHQFEATPLPHS